MVLASHLDSADMEHSPSLENLAPLARPILEEWRLQFWGYPPNDCNYAEVRTLC